MLWLVCETQRHNFKEVIHPTHCIIIHILNMGAVVISSILQGNASLGAIIVCKCTCLLCSSNVHAIYNSAQTSQIPIWAFAVCIQHFALHSSPFPKSGLRIRALPPASACIFYQDVCLGDRKCYGQTHIPSTVTIAVCKDILR